MALFSGARASLPRNPDRWKAGLEAALEVSEVATSQAPLADAVAQMLTIAVELLGAERGSIMLLEEDERTLVLMAGHGLPAEVSVGHRQPVGESVAGRVLATGRPLLLGDVDQDAFVNFVPKARTINSSVVVPLRTQGRTNGVLNLSTNQRASAFDEEDLRLAQLFADQAGAVIHRTKLHERAERRSSDLMALVESSRGLLGSLELDELLQHILDGAIRLSAAPRGFVCLLDESHRIERGMFRGFTKDTIREVMAHDEVKRAIDFHTVTTVVGPWPDPLVAVGFRTARGTKSVIVVAPEPGLVAERHDLLMAHGQQSASALGAAQLHAVLQRKESELEAIICGVPNPIVLAGSDSRIVALNPAAETLFGASAAFSAGAPVDGSLAHPRVESMLLATGEQQAEVVAGNPPRTYKVRSTDVRLPGAPTGRVLIMDDITVEREIAQTQRDFVAMIGHELRTPLTIVTGFARTLMARGQKASPEETREALSTIDAKAGQLGRLIEDLLYISGVETREAVLKHEETRLAELLGEVAEESLERFPGREVELDVPRKLHWPIDRTKVALVLRHLLANALEYSTEPEPVTVRARELEKEDALVVEVQDRGEGILSTDMPHIFERFRQIDSSSTRTHGGIGVGLYLCSQLVKLHQGRIWADSSWGKGSTFSFSLPHPQSSRNVVRLKASGGA
jgi:two-component system, OmpR family, phosphate regulon sensor histidine kinase PhoR